MFYGIILVSVIVVVESRTVYIQYKPPDHEELSFMKRYGYLPEEPPGYDVAYTSLTISGAIRKMQQFAGIPATGLIDPETKKLFRMKRCGVKDFEDSSSSLRRRRYVLQQGWNKKDITYKILNSASTFDKSSIEDLMAKCLAMWAPHGGLTFQHVTDDDQGADIKVSFVTTDHGDGFPFDGPGRVVAHAFPPTHGAMHFDDDEHWGEDPDEESDDITDFFAVAIHEVGHALGLAHSPVKASVMYPYYHVPVVKLHMDDIMGMRELYLKEQVATIAPQEFTRASDDDIPDLCYTNYDCMQVIQGRIFVFEEEWLWVLAQRKEIEPGFPRRFHEIFRGLPGHIDSVHTIYETLQGNIRIFKGRKYWEFDPTFKLIKKGNITDYGLPRQVHELTTVFLSNYNNKTYLIEYERFWRYDERKGRLDAGYPKDMSAWRKVPYPVDSAFIWKGDTFFFRGPRFWRFDNEIVQAHEYYPLPTAQVWFPCPATPEMREFLVNERP